MVVNFLYEVSNGANNNWLIIPSSLGIISLISVLIVMLFDIKQFKNVWRNRFIFTQKENSWGDMNYIIGKNTVSKDKFRELRLMKLEEPKKFRILELRSRYSPSFMKDYINKL